MKQCLNCHINVGGRQTVCPICQNKLRPEADASIAEAEAHWPTNRRARRATFLYKLQLFLVLAAIIIVLGLEYLMDLESEVFPSWSLVVTGWLISFELLLKYFLQRRFVAAPTVTICCIAVIGMLTVTARDLGVLPLFMGVVIPSILIGALAVNTLFMFILRGENSMGWMLLILLAAFVCPILYLHLKGKGGVAGVIWSSCLILAAVVLAAVIVFRGKQARAELERRMDF